MATAREVQSRIKSIKDTRKITNAMYMISSSKLMKAKKTLQETQDYFNSLQVTIGRILKNIPQMRHIYFDNREVDEQETIKRKGYIVVTADKGLVGAYNMNILKMVQKEIEKNEVTKLFIVGELGKRFFEGKDVDVVEHFNYTAQNPTISRARRITERILECYNNEEIDEVCVVYTRMVNSLSCEAVMDRVLPLSRVKFTQLKDVQDDLLSKNTTELIMFPSGEAVIESIVPNYIAGFIYGALVEAYSSEQNSRMMAMEAASRNASEMLRELEIVYNRVRQAAITQEITEVVGGAKALKKKKKKKRADNE
ncbi:MAG: ATP synthase F1 subunit gamma [Lachnospiraceae bacterium]|nr:ATP synthase F1 subunit gamma [Lachnospiraceae bacterium]